MNKYKCKCVNVMISRVTSRLVTVHFHSLEDVASEHLNAPHVLQHSSHTFNSLEIKSLQNLYEIVTVKSRNKMRKGQEKP